MNIFEIYQVHGDGGERSVGPIIGYYRTESSAKAAAKGKGYYGSDGIVSIAKAVTVDGKTYVLKSDAPIDLDGEQAKRDAELREKTLAGLTDEQKRVLNL